jgi:hypothetical protein
VSFSDQENRIEQIMKRIEEDIKVGKKKYHIIYTSNDPSEEGYKLLARYILENF